jgi:hypothetical protein
MITQRQLRSIFYDLPHPSYQEKTWKILLCMHGNWRYLRKEKNRNTNCCKDQITCNHHNRPPLYQIQWNLLYTKVGQNPQHFCHCNCTANPVQTADLDMTLASLILMNCCNYKHITTSFSEFLISSIIVQYFVHSATSSGLFSILMRSSFLLTSSCKINVVISHTQLYLKFSTLYSKLYPNKNVDI